MPILEHSTVPNTIQVSQYNNTQVPQALQQGQFSYNPTTSTNWQFGNTGLYIFTY